MAKDILPAPLNHPPVHLAKATIRFGRRARMATSVEITSGGILSIGALVSGILLSTAVLVAVSGRARGARPED